MSEAEERNKIEKNEHEKSEEGDELDEKELDEEALQKERKDLENKLVMYSPENIKSMKEENQILKDTLKSLVEDFRVAFSNRFGPTDFAQAKGYLKTLDKTLTNLESLNKKNQD
jgi:hypothetical protein